MNELQLTVQSLMARGVYSGIVIAGAYHHKAEEDPTIALEGQGTLPLGKLAVMILAGYLQHIPEHQQDMTLTYISKKAKELAKNAPSQAEK